MSFSLPLTAFEEFLLWEDRPAYPWSCFIRLRFSGRIDRERLERALSETVVRHPLLRCKVQKKKKGRFYWVADDEFRVSTQWIEGAMRGDFPQAEHLELRESIGLRLFVVRDSESSELTIQFHHACCDGAGIFVFIDDLLVAYARLQGAEVNQRRLAVFEPQRLAQRGSYGLTFWKFLKMAPKQFLGLVGAKEFMQHVPVPIVPCTVQPDDDPPPSGYPAACWHHFEREETTQLREVAKQKGVSWNDLLARDLTLALNDWRIRQGADDDQQWLRMMIPMNLRSSGDRRMSAANVVSSVFLDRKGVDCADANELLTTIHEQMEVIKRNQLGLTFIFSLQVGRWLPGGLQKMARADKCTVSSIFTNLGRLFQRSPLPKQDQRVVAGDICLDDIEILAPIRPYNGASFAVQLYAGRLSVTLHYDPRMFSAPQATNLLDTFARKVRQTLVA